MEESISPSSSRLPWITLAIVLMCCFLLFWQMSNMDRMNKFKIKILEEKINALEEGVNQLASRENGSTQVSSKDPVGSLKAIQSDITSTKASVQELKIDLQGFTNDYNARLYGLGQLDGRVSSVNKRMNAIENEIINLKQLIRQ